MAGASRNDHMVAAVQRVLDRDEVIVERGRCWAAVRREHVPLLFLGRKQYDVVLTDRRIMLFSRRRRTLRPDDVALVKRFGALTLDSERRGVPLLQQRIHTDTGAAMVIEWPPRYRRMGGMLADEIEQTAHRAEPAR
ncbi:MAG: hypothetical protein WDA60_17575 [Acidimicrobiia bacterium]|jgi:hypothetical protein